MDDSLHQDKSSADVAQLSKRLVIVIIISSFIIMAVGALVFELADIPPTRTNIRTGGETLSYNYQMSGALPFALGVAMSMVLNIAKVIMLKNAAQKVTNLTDEDKRSAGNYLKVQYLARFALTAAVLVAAAIIPISDVLGAVFGIFSWHIAMYSVKFSKKLT